MIHCFVCRMSAIANLSSVLLTQAMSTQIPASWRSVLRGQNLATESDFIHGMKFDVSKPNMFISTKTNNTGTITSTTRSVLLWVGKNQQEMDSLMWNGATSSTGLGLSVLDNQGNLFTYFAMLLVHTERVRGEYTRKGKLKPFGGQLSLYVCTCMTNTAGT